MDAPLPDDDVDDYVLPQDCTLNADGTVTMPLRFPITLTVKAGGDSAERTIDTLTVRGSTLDDLLAAEPHIKAGNIMQLQLLMATRRGGLSDLAARRLREVDVERFMALCEGFSMPGQLDGKRPQAI